MNFEPLRAFIDSLPSVGIPGADIIVKQNHKTIFRHQCGYRDREAGVPMTGDEKYYIYSCSKISTVVAALQLHEQGKFLMTDPLYAYFPEYRHMTVRRANGDVCAAQNDIHIRDLFTMTAGFDYDLTNPSFNRVKEQTNGRCPTLEMVRAMASEPLCYEPNTHWHYSLGHDVLAGFVELVSGERFTDYVKNHIFEPLGMERTHLHILPGEESEFAALYRFNDELNRAERIGLDCAYVLGPDYDSGGAGVISCVEDYSKLADALACDGIGETGERILSQASIELMKQNHLNEAQLRDFDWVQFTGYGYGLGVRTALNRPAGGILSPVGEFGWGGAAGAYFLSDSENRLSVYYGQHMLNNKEPYTHPRIRNILYANK